MLLRLWLREDTNKEVWVDRIQPTYPLLSLWQSPCQEQPEDSHRHMDRKDCIQDMVDNPLQHKVGDSRTVDTLHAPLCFFRLVL